MALKLYLDAQWWPNCSWIQVLSLTELRSRDNLWPRRGEFRHPSIPQELFCLLAMSLRPNRPPVLHSSQWIHLSAVHVTHPKSISFNLNLISFTSFSCLFLWNKLFRRCQTVYRAEMGLIWVNSSKFVYRRRWNLKEWWPKYLSSGLFPLALLKRILGFVFFQWFIGSYFKSGSMLLGVDKFISTA